MKFHATLIAGLLAVTPLVAQAQTAPNPALAKIVAAAEREGQVVFRATNTTFAGQVGAKVAQDGINRMFGTHLTVEWVPGPAYGPMAAILYQEKQANQPASTDIFIGTAIQVEPYLDKGLFQTVDWVGLMPERIPPQIVEGDKRAIRYSSALPGILYNVKGADWVNNIQSVTDLLKPEYKGKFYTTPFLGGFDVLLAPEVWGIDKTRDFVKKLSPQLAGLVGCEATDRIASGEIPALAIDCSGGGPYRIQYRGKDVIANHVIPDMAEDRNGYLAIPAHAPHPNAAILYTLYALSAEGQEKLAWDLIGLDLADLPGTHMRQQVDALHAKGIKIIDVTIDWWRTHSDLDKTNAELAKMIAQ